MIELKVGDICDIGNELIMRCATVYTASGNVMMDCIHLAPPGSPQRERINELGWRGKWSREGVKLNLFGDPERGGLFNVKRIIEP